MKRFIPLLTALTLLCALCGCEKTPNTPPTPTTAATTTVTTTAAATTAAQTTTTTATPAVPSEDMGRMVPADVTITLAGLTVRPGDDFNPLLTALGDADAVSESVAGGLWPELYFDYSYTDFIIGVVGYEDKREINQVYVNSAALPLYKGTPIGCTRDELRKRYGEPFANDDYAMTFQIQEGDATYSLRFDFAKIGENDRWVTTDTVETFAILTDAYYW